MGGKLSYRVYYAQIGTWYKPSTLPSVKYGVATPGSVLEYKLVKDIFGGRFFVKYNNVCYVFASKTSLETALVDGFNYSAGRYWDNFALNANYLGKFTLDSASEQITASELASYEGETPGTVDEDFGVDVNPADVDIIVSGPVDSSSQTYNPYTQAGGTITPDVLDDSQYYQLSGKISTMMNYLDGIAKSQGNTLSEMRSEFMALKQDFVAMTDRYIPSKADLIAISEAEQKAILDELNRIKMEERATYDLANKIKDTANDIFTLTQSEVTRSGDVYDALGDLSVPVEGIKTNIEYLRDIMGEDDEVLSGVMDEGFMQMRQINNKIDVLTNSLENSILPNLVRGLAMTIPNLAKPIDSEEFNQQINTLTDVANIIEMAFMGYTAGKVAFDEAAKDVQGRFLDFNAALTEFRSLINLINTVSQNPGYYGPYSGRLGYWEYSATPRPGFMKSKFGDYYCRKRLG